MTNTMEASIRKEIRLEGLCCANCGAKIERAAAKLPGVRSAVVDVMAQKLTLTADGGVRLPWLLTEITKTAIRIEPDLQVSFAEEQAAQAHPQEQEQDQDHAHAHAHAHDHTEAPSQSQARRHKLLLAAGVALFAVGLALGQGPALPPWARLAIFLAGYLLIGGQVLLRACKNIARGQIFDENFLMSVATIGAFALGEYPEGVAVMLFYQVGEAFQSYALGRSRKSITALLDLRPDFANLKTPQGFRRVAPESVAVGDLILVKPGEKIPLDGLVVEGRSALDTSALTGEPLPRDVAPGAEVLSGSLNQSGLLTVKVGKLFGESTVSKILALVQSAGSAKAPVENFITKFARYYTPAVVCVAAALAVAPPLALGGGWAEWVQRALVFLVVSCPCALVISIPLSFFGGIGGASRNGILVKGSNYLDALHNVDTVVFDKTGTLTQGVFAVADIVPAAGFSREGLLELAACAEAHSNHPIAVSVRKAYGGAVPQGRVAEYEEAAGLGVRARVDGKRVLAGNAALMEEAGVPVNKPDTLGSVVYLAVEGTFAGCLVIADQVKPDSGKAIEDLKALGVRRTAMLTGDSRAAAEKIGGALGLDTVCAELLPQHKVAELEKLFATKGKGALLFVGDGINDAPVLARADVGVAMGGVGSDAAIEAADIVLMTDEPSKLAEAIKISKQTRAIVLQNIVFALAVKGLVLTLGALGYATMWEAVFGDVGVAVLAILNAMRAMKKGRRLG